MALLTLTTDFGSRDYISGAVKGTILSTDERFNICDITNTLSPFNYPQAAYICKNTIDHFPKGSFHLIMVDLFDAKPSHVLIAEHNGSYIGCADNGLVTMILDELSVKVASIKLDRTRPRNAIYLANVFAENFKLLLDGAELLSLNDPEADIVVKNPLRPMTGPDWMEGQIIFIDSFENVVVNITREDFEQQRRGRKFLILFKRDEKLDKISESYADVPPGEKLAMFNSAGYLEIAINKGNAAGLFGLQGFIETQDNVQKNLHNFQFFYQTVKVLFE